jgi:hypothetical protein
MTLLFLSFLSLVATLGVFPLRNLQAKLLVGPILSSLASVFFLSFCLYGEPASLSWIESFQFTLETKVQGFDLVSQFFVCLLFPFLHFFSYRRKNLDPFHLFSLVAAQLAYEVSIVSGNAFIDFQALVAIQLIGFLFIRSSVSRRDEEITPWLVRTFLGFGMIFCSLVMVYFFRDSGSSSLSYSFAQWTATKEWKFAFLKQDFYVQIRDLSFFLLYSGLIFVSGLLDFKGKKTEVLHGISGKRGALISVLLYVFPTLFFLRISLGIFPESLARFRTEILVINLLVFIASSLKVGNQKNMKSKLVHFPGVFCALILFVIPSLDAGVILGSVFFLFATLYLMVATLVSLDSERNTVAKQPKKIHSVLYVVFLGSALFFPLSISFSGLVDIFVGLREQSILLTPIVGVIFFFSWFSMIHFFSREKGFARLSLSEAGVILLFLSPPLLLGSVPKRFIEPFIQIGENYIKGTN